MDVPERIFLSNSDQSLEISEPKISAILVSLTTAFGIQNYDISLSFVSREEIKDLNSVHRGKDTATDVLSFPQLELTAPLQPGTKINASPSNDGPPSTLGDIVICVPVARTHASEIGHDLDREIGFLMIHGLLHLVGYDHVEPQDESVMIAMQKQMFQHLEQTVGANWWEGITSSSAAGQRSDSITSMEPST